MNKLKHILSSKAKNSLLVLVLFTALFSFSGTAVKAKAAQEQTQTECLVASIKKGKRAFVYSKNNVSNFQPAAYASAQQCARDAFNHAVKIKLRCVSHRPPLGTQVFYLLPKITTSAPGEAPLTC